MNIDPSTQREAQFTGRHMALIMVGFFGVIVAVNMTMATMASKSWTGLVVKNSYVASQDFNAELQQAKAQQASGLRSDLTYFDGKLIFSLKDKNGTRLTAAGLTAEIGRPAFEQADRELAFLGGPNQSYKLAIDLAPGVWSLKITGEVGGASYRRDARLFVDSSGKGRLE